MSFLPDLPSLRYGLTKLAAISRASKPIALRRRAQACAPLHASIATRQPGGNCAFEATTMAAERTVVIDGPTFIARFMQHVLPP